MKELKQYNAKDGRPTYIAYKGKVYDVTDSALWINGEHEGEHVAGKDLTEEIADAPNGEEELRNVKRISTLVS